MTGIVLSDLDKVFATRKGTVTALSGISMDRPRGSFTALIGPSGCGKSTILRILAGLDDPTAGTATVHGEPPRAARKQHHTGVAFQDAALLPWRTVAANIAFPLQIAEIGRAHV